MEDLATFPGVNKINKIYHLYKINMAFSLEKFKSDFPDYQWFPLEKGIEEFIEVNKKRGNFPDPGEDFIEDKIISAWKKQLSGWRNKV